MQKSKLVFSATELQLASDTEWILTKNGIIDKVYILFGDLSETLENTFSQLKNDLPEVLHISPKISKGEKYEGLPWVMLDYPRYFQGDPGHFAMRTFFWWGNYFLIQAQFSNSFIPKIVNGIEKKIVPTQIGGYQLYAGYPEIQWNNTIPQPGLYALKPNILYSKTSENGIFKMAIKVPVKDWALVNDIANSLAGILVNVWKEA